MASSSAEGGFPDDDSADLAIIQHEVRVLTAGEVEKLEKDTNLVSEFKQKKYELEARKNWDKFYKRNTTKFFKDRHWTKREFGELFEKKADRQTIVLEVGCGVGNFVFPLLEEYSHVLFYACDFSQNAVNFVKEHELYDPSRCSAFCCDITCEELTINIEANSVDVVSMVFVLSAIHPDKMVSALKNISTVLRPGGCLLFRDYGLYDHAMLRFASGHKLSEYFYVRQDLTRAYYFSLDKIKELTQEAGFTVKLCDYVQRETTNRKEGICVPRIFVQGQFIKDCLNLNEPNKSINN